MKRLVANVKNLTVSYDQTTARLRLVRAEANRKRAQLNRELRLPRSVRVQYPRSVQDLPDNWTQRAGLLVARLNEEIVGYASLMLNIAPVTAWATDLAVVRRLRRQGIGSGLLLALREWELGAFTALRRGN